MPKACAEVEKNEVEMRQHLIEAGVKFNTVPPADEAAVRSTLSGVRDTWTMDLDKRGKSASQVLLEYDATLKAMEDQK